MRMTYTMMLNQFLRNISSVGSTDTNIIAEFNSHLGATYQLMLSKLRNYKTVRQQSFTTYTGAMPNSSPAYQYYPYPEGEVNIEGITVTVGSVNFPLKIINSLASWQQLNAILIQASALPQFYFPRTDDFGIWPIPQSANTGLISYHYRDRNLGVADYTTGTISVTANSTTITGSGTTFTAAMVGRWFYINDTTASGQGYWYRVSAYTSATVLTLNTPYTGSTGSGYTYVIGESPEIPEEGHMTLVDGVTGAFYSHYRKDLESAAQFNNLFCTGDSANNNREEGNTKISGGLIGLINRYNDRDDTKIINRNPRLNPLPYKVWGTTLS